MADLLRNNIAKYANITDEDFNEIKNRFDIRHFRKGDFIIKENEKVSFIYFIFSGLVRLSYWDDKGNEHIVSFAMEDWWETDFMAFYNGTPATCTLQCMEPTSVYRLSLENYRNLCLSLPYMASYFLDKSMKGHIADQKRILSLLTLSPKEKYEQFLQTYPSLVQRIPKIILASYLGVSRETLSRLHKHR